MQMISDERLGKIEQLVSDSLNDNSVVQKVCRFPGLDRVTDAGTGRSRRGQC